jgi:hypothetical protein
MQTPSLVFDQSTAQKILDKHKEVLFSAIGGAFDDWSALLQKAPEQTSGLSMTLRARYIHDRTVSRLEVAEINGDCPGLRLRNKQGLKVAIIEDKLILKFKKLDAGLRSSNIQTRQTVEFDNQAQLIVSDGGRMTNATSGYVLDAETKLPVNWLVVCWSGDDKKWVVNLCDETKTAEGLIVNVDATPVAAKRRTKVVKPVEAGVQSEAE